MTDIYDWVQSESRNLGVDFSCLSQNVQNNIISSLMSGIENGFRSRMDSPDLRFAGREGISKFESNKNKITTEPFSTSSADSCIDSCTHLECMYACDGTCHPADNTRCLDPNCSYPTTCQFSTCTDTDNCTENDSKTCDNWCSNSQLSSCTNGTCIDMKCSNGSSMGGEICKDTGTGCIDNMCRNSSSVGSSECTDIGGCSDSVCCNRTCSDGNSSVEICQDDVCANGNTCEDAGLEGSGGCNDSACIDSGTRGTPSCTNSRCYDAPCVNFNQCTDDSVSSFCTDSTCNNLGCADRPTISSCSDATASACSDNNPCQYVACDKMCLNPPTTCTDVDPTHCVDTLC